MDLPLPGRRSRQRIHDDRQHDCPGALAQRRRCQKRGADQAIERSRGGLTTKIHAICDALGNPVELALTPGQDADFTHAEPLVENIGPDALLADNGYDANRLIDKLTQRVITPVIPPKSNRAAQRGTDFTLYKKQNLIERFFNKFQPSRAIVTRYDKLIPTFLAAVQFASIIILLN